MFMEASLAAGTAWHRAVSPRLFRILSSFLMAAAAADVAAVWGLLPLGPSPQPPPLLLPASPLGPPWLPRLSQLPRQLWLPQRLALRQLRP